MKIGTGIWGLLGTALFVIGCGSSDTGDRTVKSKEDGAAKPAEAKPVGKWTKKDLKITMIAKSSANPVFISAHKGADDAAKDLSKETGVNITIDWQTPPTEDGQVQAQKIAEAVSGGSDAILLSCSDAAKVTSAIDEAVAKGVPVMTFDSDAAQSKRFSFYGANDADAGMRTMKELCALIHDKGTVAILAGNQNAPNLQARVKGAQDEAKNHPGVKVIPVVYHPETPQDATKEVIATMKANPEVNGWAMIGSWPLFAPGLMNEIDPSKVVCVGIDALPAELPYVDKGIAPVLLAQPVYKWGYFCVERIIDKLVKGKETQASYPMELERVTKDNLTKWAEQLQDWGFKDIDPKFLATSPAAPAPPAKK